MDFIKEVPATRTITNGKRFLKEGLFFQVKPVYEPWRGDNRPMVRAAVVNAQGRYHYSAGDFFHTSTSLRNLAAACLEIAEIMEEYE